MNAKIFMKILPLTIAVCLALTACASTATPGEDTSGKDTTMTPETSVPSSTPEAKVASGDIPEVVGTGADTMLAFPKDMEAPAELKVWPVEEGTGALVKETDMVLANYVGQVWGQGVAFDSSFARGGAISFPLSGVIDGWREGLAGQKVGAKVILSIPSELGYGPSGGMPQAGIGPNDTLAFYVEIVDATPAA